MHKKKVIIMPVEFETGLTEYAVRFYTYLWRIAWQTSKQVAVTVGLSMPERFQVAVETFKMTNYPFIYVYEAFKAEKEIEEYAPEVEE